MRPPDFLKTLKHEGARKVLVIFSILGTPPGSFTFFNSLSGVEANLIFINCPDSTYYINEIPGVGRNIEEISECLNRLCYELGGVNHEAVFFGASMGGTGAVLYGSMHPNARVLAFAPALDLSLLGGAFSCRFKGDLQGVPKNLFECFRSKNRFCLIYGALDALDMMDLRGIPDTNNIELIVLGNYHHGIATTLHNFEGRSDGIVNWAMSGRMLGEMPLIANQRRSELPFFPELVFNMFRVVGLRSEEALAELMRELQKRGGYGLDIRALILLSIYRMKHSGFDSGLLAKIITRAFTFDPQNILSIYFLSEAALDGAVNDKALLGSALQSAITLLNRKKCYNPETGCGADSHLVIARDRLEKILGLSPIKQPEAEIQPFYSR